MSEESAQAQDAVEQVTQEVKDVKLENGAGPANGTPAKNEDNAVPLKVRTNKGTYEWA